jgi:hypothetical protein
VTGARLRAHIGRQPRVATPAVQLRQCRPSDHRPRRARRSPCANTRHFVCRLSQACLGRGASPARLQVARIPPQLTHPGVLPGGWIRCPESGARGEPAGDPSSTRRARSVDRALHVSVAAGGGGLRRWPGRRRGPASWTTRHLHLRARLTVPAGADLPRFLSHLTRADDRPEPAQRGPHGLTSRLLRRVSSRRGQFACYARRSKTWSGLMTWVIAVPNADDGSSPWLPGTGSSVLSSTTRVRWCSGRYNVRLW